MIAELEAKREELAALCHRFGVARLELFGSAARGADFAPERSDLDFLVTLTPPRRHDLGALLALREALEALFHRPVDLLEREAIEASRNPIRRRRILAEARPLYAA
ncbi:MAG TPA: nucleotidyltransferase domain-containing protein [Roseococcus sp.]|jgi:hypothetical protein|nr:nucleotidyltransferase domain-containing protein [Roseococcus sp.]